MRWNNLQLMWGPDNLAKGSEYDATANLARQSPIFVLGGRNSSRPMRSKGLLVTVIVTMTRRMNKCTVVWCGVVCGII
jgi:S-formylglutathione hydrolase FrmB